MTSIGKDLATIRYHKKLTIEEIHQRTRIPLDTLKRIENGTIFDDPDQNPVYLRSFVRTYGRALNLNDERVLQGLDQQKAGNYNRLLLDAFPGIDRDRSPQPIDPDTEKPAESSRPGSSTVQPDAAGKEPAAGKPGTADPKPAGGKPDSAGSTSASETPEKPSESKERSQAMDSSTPSDRDDKSHETSEKGALAAGKTAKGTRETSPEPEPPKPKQEIDWAEMGHRFSNASSGGGNGWIFGVILFVLALAAGIWLLIQSDLLSNTFQAADQDDSEPAAAEAPAPEGHELSLDLADDVELDSDNADEDGLGEGELASMLFLTVHATYDRLEPVRVWSDLKPRMDPYWVEQGQAFNFEFQDTIRVRTDYNRMLLFLNGHLIENPRENYFNESENAIELTRDMFEEEGRYASEVDLELPEEAAAPDSIPNRPMFQ